MAAEQPAGRAPMAMQPPVTEVLSCHGNLSFFCAFGAHTVSHGGHHRRHLPCDDVACLQNPALEGRAGSMRWFWADAWPRSAPVHPCRQLLAIAPEINRRWRRPALIALIGAPFGFRLSICRRPFRRCATFAVTRFPVLPGFGIRGWLWAARWPVVISMDPRCQIAESQGLRGR